MSWQWFGLRFPSERDADSVLRFTRNLAVRPRRGLLMRADPVVCEVEARNGRLRWRLGVTDRDAAQVLGALRLALPGLRTEAIDAARPVLDRAWELRLNDHQRPLRTDVPAPVAGALL